jgi:hypothetical protein
MVVFSVVESTGVLGSLWSRQKFPMMLAIREVMKAFAKREGVSEA